MLQTLLTVGEYAITLAAGFGMLHVYLRVEAWRNRRYRERMRAQGWHFGSTPDM